MELSELKWDAAGLVAVVVQERHSGDVRMVAYANQAAIEATLAQGEAHFFSRSRNRMWRKGETSGNTMAVAEVWADCDGDAVLYLVDPRGPSCHTGRRTCFFRSLTPGLPDADSKASVGGAPTLIRLWLTLKERQRASAKPSYTRSLLEGGPSAIAKKVREEAGELAEALVKESDKRVVSEASDLLYHTLVGLLARDVTLRDVQAELARRFARSGHEEKASRDPSGQTR